MNATVPSATSVDAPPTSPPPDRAPERTRRPASRWLRRLLLALGLAVLVVAVGNGAIVGTSALLRSSAPPAQHIDGVGKFVAVDDHVWRGAAPSPEGYRTLAERGVRTVVDLRAEEDLPDTRPLLASVGVDLVRIPIRDGQAPTDEQVRQFLSAVRQTDGVVFVHCGAGIGRTGVMAATYLVEERGVSPREALKENLEQGPPSLEQISYVADLERRAGDGTEIERPNAVVVAASRVLDAPRRLWSRYGI